MKYYKILKNDMIHHSFQYKEGLNVDTNPFNETSNCGGGLFFSDAENILSFRQYGDLIAEVEIPAGTKIVQVGDKYKAHAIIIKNIKPIWTVDTFKYFIEEGIDIHTENDWAFRYAAENGNLELVKFLVDNNADIHAYNDYAFRYAAGYGYLDIVEYLIDKGVDIHTENDWAFRHAVENGHLDVVRYLFDNGVNVHIMDDAIIWAAANNHLDMVEYLVSKGADIHACDDLAFRLAVSCCHLNIIKYLVNEGVDIHMSNDWALKFGPKKVISYLKH